MIIIRKIVFSFCFSKLTKQIVKYSLNKYFVPANIGHCKYKT